MASKPKSAGLSPLLEGALSASIILSVVITIWSNHPFTGNRTGKDFFLHANPRRRMLLSSNYPSGRCAEKGIMLGSHRIGKWLKFHDIEGSPVYIKSNYKDGLYNGPYESFTKDGSPLIRGQYRMGLQTGQWDIYSQGKLRESLLYDQSGRATRIFPSPPGKDSEAMAEAEAIRSRLSRKAASFHSLTGEAITGQDQAPCGPSNER